MVQWMRMVRSLMVGLSRFEVEEAIEIVEDERVKDGYLTKTKVEVN